MYNTKKTVVVNRPSIIQARHLFFNWKQETRRERVPSAPEEFLTSLILQGLKGGHMTPPLTFERSKKLRE